MEEFQTQIEKLEQQLQDKQQHIEELQKQINFRINNQTNETEQINQLNVELRQLELQNFIQKQKADNTKMDLKNKLTFQLDQTRFKEMQVNDLNAFMESLKTVLEGRENELLQVREKMVNMVKLNNSQKNKINEQSKQIEQEVLKLKTMEIKYKEQRDKEINKITLHFKDQIERKQQQYELIMESNTKELNHWRSNFEQQIKQNILLIDDINKKDIIYKDWNKQKEKIETQNADLVAQQANQIKEVSFTLVYIEIELLNFQLNSAGKDLNQKKNVMQLLKEKIVQIQYVKSEQFKDQVESSIQEKLRIENINLELERKIELEQMQSVLTFERFKAAEQQTNLKRQFDTIQKKNQIQFEEHQVKISHLYTQNISLLKQCEDDQTMITNIRAENALNLAQDQYNHLLECEKLNATNKSKIIQMNAVNWMKALVWERKLNEANQVNSQTIMESSQSMQKQESAQTVLQALVGMSEKQIDVIRQKFTVELQEQITQQNMDKDQISETRIASLQSQNQTLRNQVINLKDTISQYQINDEEKANIIKDLNKKILEVKDTHQGLMTQLETKKQNDITEINELYGEMLGQKDNEVSNKEKQINGQSLTIRNYKTQNKILKDQVKSEQDQIIKKFTQSKDQTFNEVSMILQQQQEYITLLLGQITQLKQKLQSTFQWRGNNKIEKDVDKFVGYYFSRAEFYSTRSSSRSQNHPQTPNTTEKRIQLFELNDAKQHIKRFLGGNFKTPVIPDDSIQERQKEIERVKQIVMRGEDQNYEFSKNVFAPQRKKTLTPRRNSYCPTGRESRIYTIQQ